MNTLYEGNVMDYFSLSPFYEKNSINQKCAVQGVDFTTHKFKETGIEFNIEMINKEKDLYLISKNYRKYNECVLISYFYVFKGTIYQAPDVYSVLTSNIQSTANNLLNIMDELREYK